MGRPIARWWDVVAGVRQDLRPGDAQTWAALGVQGLAPYRIDVELTGYLGANGRSQLRADAAHDLRLTRRLVAQTRLEATFAGKPGPGPKRRNARRDGSMPRRRLPVSMRN